MSNAQYFHHLYNLLHREKPFYGSGLEESLERIPEEHLYKPVGHRTIAQLLEHMLVWRDDLARRLNGEERQKIEFNGPLDWPPAADCKRTKAEYVAAFAAITTRIKAGIAGFDYAKIDDLLHPDYDYTHVDLLE
ncbi:MAG: DinB family protein, partial [Bacteroidota bacterium]